MRKLAAIFLFVALLLAVAGEQAYGRRNSNTVRRERSDLEQRRRDTRQRLQQTLEQTEAQLNHLQSLEAQIETNSRREQNLARRVDSISARSSELTDSIARLTVRVERADSSYRQSLRSIRSQRRRGGSVGFVFAAESFRQAFRRIRYLQQLADWNASESRRLREQRAQLSSATQRLDSTANRLERAQRLLGDARARLESDREDAAALVAGLRERSDDLNRLLAQQQQRMDELDRELDRIIEAEAEEARAAEAARAAREAEEAARAAREAEDAARAAEAAGAARNPVEAPVPDASAPSTPPAPAPQPAVQLPSAEQLTASFVGAKGRLPMPVEGEATIVSRFGRRAHTEYSHVEIQNNGVDIEARPGARALAVHEGQVSMVIVMEGFRNVVLVRHGEYLTVYAGLEELSVRKGQHVAAGQPLGVLHSPAGDDHGTRLHFEVRHEKEKLDPGLWLR